MYAVIMAGGVGTRFWPRSRRRRPKQLLPITGSKTMIRLTLERLQPLVEPERVLVVTGAEQAEAIAAELPELPRQNLLVEPMGRNTAPCIGLAASVMQARGDQDESMAVLAADHVIRDPEQFRDVLQACDQLLLQEDHLLTLGIRPHRAETGYGYIRKGEERQRLGAAQFCTVAAFLEKPERQRALALVADGQHLWNSGMFVWKGRRILQELARHLPELSPGLERLQQAWGTPAWTDQLKQEYEGFTNISIDYGVMEKADDVWVVEVDFGWSDVGSWASLPELRTADAGGNLAPEGTLVLDSEGNIVEGQGKQIVLLGVSDLIVVEEEDAILICHRDHAQSVGKIPERLRQAGKDHLT